MNGAGNIIAIGDQKDGYYQGGRVRMYRNNEGSWEQLGDDIEGTIAHEFLGTSIAINDDGSVIAALSSRRVVVYENQNDSLVQFSNDISTDYFGGQHRVDISGDAKFIGFSDTHNNVGGGDDAGNVRVFQYIAPVPVFDTITVEICENELPYIFGTQTLITEGTFTEVFQATTGVDSTVTLDLVVHGLPNPDFSYDADTLSCLNQYSSYQWYSEEGLIEGATSKSYIIEKSGTYYLEVTDENGCTAMSGGVQLIKTGNKEFENNAMNISIIPNPNYGNFKIRIVNAKKATYNVEIYSSLGKKVIERELIVNSLLQDEEFDLRGYPSGNYVIRIDEEQVQQIIIFIKL
jgi:hypothetical protein